jgi:hypothetical protein
LGEVQVERAASFVLLSVEPLAHLVAVMSGQNSRKKLRIGSVQAGMIDKGLRSDRLPNSRELSDRLYHSHLPELVATARAAPVVAVE